MTLNTIRRTLATLALMLTAAIPPGCGDGGSNAPKPTGADAATTPGGEPAATQPELTLVRFGIISTESTSGLKKGFEPFIADMGRSLGVEVKAFFAPTYAGVIEAMRFDQVELGWFGNKSAMEAIDRAGGEVFAQTVNADGSPGYWSLIITRKDARYKTLDDIIAHGKELTFGNGDSNSTSGNLIPLHYVWNERGIDPRSHFKRTLNASHGANLLAVANQQIDFATNNTKDLSNFQQQQPRLADTLHVVWKSPLIPADPLVWRKNMPEATKAKIRGFIYGYGKGEGPEAERQRKVLLGLNAGWAPFEPATNDHVSPIREIELARQIVETEASTSLSDDERRSKLAALRAELDTLRASRRPATSNEAASAS